MRTSLFLFALLVTIPLVAQQHYTDLLQRPVQGQGKITLYQSGKITSLVNGTSVPQEPVAVGKRATQAGGHVASRSTDSLDTLPPAVKTSGQRMRVNGYRIQVYSGDNSRKGKNEAAAMGRRVKAMFPELSVYTHFISPHWICRVGDFRTYEEASEYFRRMRESGQFAEAVMVRSKVTVYY